MSFRVDPLRKQRRSSAHHYARAGALGAVLVFGPMSCIGRTVVDGSDPDGADLDGSADNESETGGRKSGSGAASSTGARSSDGGRRSRSDGGGFADDFSGSDDISLPAPTDGGSSGSGGASGDGGTTGEETGQGGEGGEDAAGSGCEDGFRMDTVCTECGAGGGCRTEQTGCFPECDSTEQCADGTFCSDGLCRLFCV